MKVTVSIDGKSYTRKVRRSYVYYNLEFREKLPIITIKGVAYVVFIKNGTPIGFYDLNTYMKQQGSHLLPDD